MSRTIAFEACPCVFVILSASCSVVKLLFCALVRDKGQQM